jgi:hypothetical protein
VKLTEYLALPDIGTSDIIAALRTPAHYHARVVREATEATVLGTAAHAAILQPELYRSTYVVAPVMDRRTKDWKEWKAENVIDGHEIITQPDAWLVQGMAAAVMANPVARDLISRSQVECTLQWTDPETGLRCKARPDLRPMHDHALGDLKTAADASYRAFQRAIYSFGYHIQAAHALEGLATINGESCNTWVWIVVEKEPPFAVALYQADDITLDTARRERRRALGLIAACEKAGEFPGYPQDIQPIGLPPWAE